MVADSYQMGVAFTRSVACLLCTDRDFYSVIADAIDPTKLPDPPSQLLASVAVELGKKIGHGPTFQGTCQGISVQLIEGKIKKELANEALEILSEHFVENPDEIRTILAEMLRKDARREVVRQAVDIYGKGKDLTPIIEAARKAEAIGIKSISSIGTILGPEAFEEIESIRNIDKLPTGIIDLDIELGGGTPRGSQTIFIGPHGSGKSMTLSSLAAYNLLHGHTVAYASLELGRSIVTPRIVAAILGMPINSVISGGFDSARSQLEAMSHRLGRCVVEKFDAGTTTMLDLEAWIARTEQALGTRIDVLVVDYLDKMGSHLREDYGSTYKAQNSVAERMRLYVERTGKWCFTASQPKRRDLKTRQTQVRIEGEDAADSMGKVRVADIVITINPTADRSAYGWYIDKHRTHDCAGKMIGPIPHERHIGRIAPFAVGPNSMIVGIP